MAVTYKLSSGSNPFFYFLFMNKTLINFLIAIKNASTLKRELVKIFYNKKFILLFSFDSISSLIVITLGDE